MKTAAQRGRVEQPRGFRPKHLPTRNRIVASQNGPEETKQDYEVVTIINRHGHEEDVLRDRNGNIQYITQSPLDGPGPALELKSDSKPSSRSSQRKATNRTTPRAVVPAIPARDQFDRTEVDETLLDGFRLLKACHVREPNYASRARLASQGLKDVVEDDFLMFPHLQFVDVSDNHLPLFPFGLLPVLNELNLGCNKISDIEIPTGGFKELEVLDLSYNQVTLGAIMMLSHLPKLRFLDLTGNELSDVPARMDAFSRLQRLDLDRNKFTDARILLGLSTLPSLTELNLNYNKLECVPEGITGFRALKLLHLGCNLLEFEEDVLPLVALPVLQKVHLWENPITRRQKGLPPAVQQLLVERRNVRVTTEEEEDESPPILVSTASRIDVGSEIIERNKTAVSQSGTAPTTAFTTARGLMSASMANLASSPREDESASVAESAGTGNGNVAFLTQVDIMDEVMQGRISPTARMVGLRAPPPKRAAEPGDYARVRAAMRQLRQALSHPRVTVMPDAKGAVARQAKIREREARLGVTPAPTKPRRTAAQIMHEALSSVEPSVVDEEEDAGDEEGAERQPSPEAGLDDMAAMLMAMRERLAAVETNLAHVLRGDALLQQRVPNSEDLLTEAREEYEAAHAEAVREKTASR